MIIKSLLVGLVLFCSMGAGPCWVKHHVPVVQTLVPVPVVVYPVLIQQPVVVQVYQPQIIVPNVQMQVQPVYEYRSYFMNTGHYYHYNQVPYYNPWVGYNY
jgi:hypothetical protein